MSLHRGRFLPTGSGSRLSGWRGRLPSRRHIKENQAQEVRSNSAANAGPGSALTRDGIWPPVHKTQFPTFVETCSHAGFSDERQMTAHLQQLSIWTLEVDSKTHVGF